MLAPPGEDRGAPARYYHYLGLSCQQSGRHAYAIIAFERATAMGSDYPEAKALERDLEFSRTKVAANHS